ncbi:MAG: ABC transporter permease [Actinomycetota bacterium]
MSEPGFFGQVVEWFSDPSNWQGPAGVPTRLIEHLVLSAIPILIAAAIALPAAMFVGHTRRFEVAIVTIANIGRAIPSYALLVIMVILTGLGDWPIIVALTLLAIPPILTNGYVGIQSVDPDTIEAARGMGMRERGILLGIEIPLGAPLIVAGLRIAALQVIATATLAALVAGGGLGRIVVDGLAVRDFPQVFSGALLVALLAGLTEGAFALLQRWASPRHGFLRPTRGLSAEQPPVPLIRPADQF